MNIYKKVKFFEATHSVSQHEIPSHAIGLLDTELKK